MKSYIKIKLTDVKKYLLRTASVLAILLAVSVTYSNAIDTPFQLDDQHMIENNRQIGDIENYLKTSQWLALKFNRVLPQLTFAINFHFNKYNVKGYHLTNIAIHIINSLLVYFLILSLFRFEIVKRERIWKHSELIAFFGAIIFAVHPMQMQAVTYLTQRLASISTLFYLAGALAYLKGRELQTQKMETALPIFLYVIVFLSFYLGMRSKQNIATLPLALLAIEFFFVRNKEGKFYKNFLLIFLTSSVFVALFYFFFVGIPHAKEAPSATIYLATQFRALVIYIIKLFFPFSLKLYYDLPFSESFFGFYEISSFLVLTGIIISSFYLFKRARLLSFGIIWFFITMLVESSIFPLKFSFFEYRVYPGMFGYALFLPAFFFYSFENIKPVIIFTALTIVAFAYAGITYQTNKVWKDPILLWKDNVTKTPEYALPYSNVGTYYLNENMYDSAMVYFNKAIELDSTLTYSYLNRGIIYFQKGDLDAALQDYNLAIRWDEKNLLAYNNRGYLFMRIGDYARAIEDLKKAISLSKKYHQTYGNLSIVYNAIGEYKKAFEAINKAIEMRDDIPSYYINRGNIHFSIKDFHVAAANYNKAILLSDSSYQSLNNFAIAQRALKNFEKSIAFSEMAIRKNPEYIPAYLNKALAENSLGRKKEALKDVETCLSINPNNVEAQIIKGGLEGKKKVVVKIDPEFVYKKGDEVD